MTQADVNKTLNEWAIAIENLLTSISEKNLKNFKSAYSDGCRYFRAISTYITANNISDTLKKRILTISDQWSTAAAPLSQWKDEIGLELNNVKQGNKVRSKITKAYFFKPSKIGVNIKRKVR